MQTLLNGVRMDPPGSLQSLADLLSIDAVIGCQPGDDLIPLR